MRFSGLKPISSALAVVVLLVPLACEARAQTSDNVLLVINESSPASIQLGEYYASKRVLAENHVVRIKTPPTDSLERLEYLRAVESPIAAVLSKNSLQDKILYIVLTKGVPLRVAGTAGLEGSVASVDSELTLLYRKLVGTPVGTGGRIPNPYFLADRAISQAKPFTRFLADIYLVTRLDAFTVNDAMKLVDHGVAPSSDGGIVLDERATVTDRVGDDWLQQAADRLTQLSAGDRVTLETTRAAATARGPVIGYYSWGSNDPSGPGRRVGLTFSPGAIGGTFVSTDGRTFAEPPADWNPGGQAPQFGGSLQSLAGDLIRDGITGVSAHVAEPFLDGTIRPQILFPAYLAGFNLAESFYLAMPFLSWQTVIVGDPLCTPFPRKPLTPGDLDKGIDPDTELPALLADRRLATFSRAGLNLDAVKLALKADGELDRGNQTGAEALLSRAVQLEPRLSAAGLRLASFYEERGEWDRAIARYRNVLAADAQNVTALNNLAYALAERTHAPKEALPFAEKAARLSSEPNVIDTLGWIHHLLGEDREAVPLLERAVASAPDRTEILIHAATVHAALNNQVKARAELAAAERLSPDVSERADVKALREKLKLPPPD